jgi:opacity protein-like surface antigen
MKPTCLVSSRFHSIAAGLALGASLLAAHAQIPWATEGFFRQNKLEVYGVGEYLHQDHTTFSGPYGGTIKMTLDDTGLGGAGVAWHFNDFFSVHSDFLFGPATFRAQAAGGPSYTVGQDAFLQSGRFNLDYNIINRRLTPFLTGGIGYQYFELNHYDYYYDHYYYETDFTWNAGAGLRWNITDRLFIKLTGGAQWLQYSGAHNITTQIEASFSIGCTF